MDPKPMKRVNKTILPYIFRSWSALAPQKNVEARFLRSHTVDGLTPGPKGVGTHHPSVFSLSRLRLGFKVLSGRLGFSGNLKRPHPTSPQMVAYIGNSTRMTLKES